MAEYMIYPSKALVHVVPPTLDPFHAAFVEPLACSLHAVELGNIQVSNGWTFRVNILTLVGVPRVH